MAKKQTKAKAKAQVTRPTPKPKTEPAIPITSRIKLRRFEPQPQMLIGVALCVLLLAHVSYYFPRVVDDIFISLRYAENLANGRGAVYNVGERVEGFSGPSWMLIQAIGITLGFEPVTFTKILGIGFLIATAFGARTMARELFGVTGWPSWLPAFFCAMNPYLVAWTVFGLETPLHVAMIVLCPIAVRRALDNPSRKTFAIAIVALVALGSSRPESALYVGANLIAPLASVRSRAAFVDLVRRAWPLLISLAILGGGLLVRLAYYKEIFPNTYHVKGAHSSFSIDKLMPLWTDGSRWFETILFVGGTVLVLWFVASRPKGMAAALSLVLCLYFSASVAVDWMPSLRHLLPITVIAPIGWACAVEWMLASRFPKSALIAGVAILPCYGHLASVDVRLSAIEHSDHWVVWKSKKKWNDTLLSYREIEPQHVTEMDDYEMGQISQAWAVLETSEVPIEQSWFAGRDVGAVGYYTGVNIFDTAGLVTRSVSRSEAWTVRNEVTDDLIQSMMSHHPVAGEVYDGWDAALGRHPALLLGYRIRAGPPEAPVAFIAKDRIAPTKAEISKRYDAFVKKFPQRYHLHTLYGESMGAAALKRQRVVAR